MFCEIEKKLCYTEREAGEALHAAKRRHKTSTAKKIPVKKYYCEHCRFFHLSSSFVRTLQTDISQKRQKIRDDEAKYRWRKESENLSSYRNNRY